LYMGGEFVAGLLKWNGSTWAGVPPGSSPSVNGPYVYALVSGY